MSPCSLCAAGPALWENDLWAVRHIEPPYGVVGWMVLACKRHIPGVTHLEDHEAASFGLTLRHLERVLLQTTGALRIYTAALGEVVQHLHVHMVPRRADGPAGWALFDTQRAAKANELAVDDDAVQDFCAAYAKALRAFPPPP